MMNSQNTQQTIISGAKTETILEEEATGENTHESVSSEEEGGNSPLNRSFNMNRRSEISSAQSTPKIEKALMNRSSELIKEFAPPSMEYSYYVIASPVVGRRKVSATNSAPSSNMTSRSYSFVSMSSRDSQSSSEVSAVVQPRKRAPKSRGLLQSVKEKLLAEIENINVELVKMDSEKLVLVNLRNASLLYRDMICKSERNNQGIPNAGKLRASCESIELKIQDEEHALQDDLAIPSIDEIRKDLKEILKVCSVITNNKSTNMKMTLVEELLCAVGKLYGVVDTILVIFYEDLNDDDSDDGLENTGERGDEVDNVVECKESGGEISPVASSPELAVDESENVEENRANETNNTTIESIIENRTNGARDSSFCLKGDQSASSISIDLSGKIGEELKHLQKKLSKAKKLFKGIERLSSGNPKPKSLSLCFKEINSTITEELIRELSYEEAWCQVIKKNVVDLQKHLMAERPGERELEHIKIIVGELTGRISIIMKSNMLE
eukprot:TCONS_00057339-protein